MVLTRSQSSKNNQSKPENMEYYSDNENDISIPECNSRGVTNEIESANL